MILTHYITTRLNGIKFFILSILLSCLLFDFTFTISQWVVGILFLFISFVAFRFLDDAGSVYFDRKDYPERKYLENGNYLIFLKTTGVLVLIYLTILAFISIQFLIIIASLIALSILSYLLFKKNRFLLSIIPLLKYPVLLACLSLWLFDSISISIVLSSFFIMSSYDSLEGAQPNNFRFWLSMLLLMNAGILLFHPYLIPIHWTFVMLIFIIIPFIKKGRNLQIVPILYYPIITLLLHLL